MVLPANWRTFPDYSLCYHASRTHSQSSWKGAGACAGNAFQLEHEGAADVSYSLHTLLPGSPTSRHRNVGSQRSIREVSRNTAAPCKCDERSRRSAGLFIPQFPEQCNSRESDMRDVAMKLRVEALTATWVVRSGTELSRSGLLHLPPCGFEHIRRRRENVSEVG